MGLNFEICEANDFLAHNAAMNMYAFNLVSLLISLSDL